MKAKEYLDDNIHVYCANKREWETDKLSITPSGDFIDDKGRMHSAKSHIPFVQYGASIVAIDMVKEQAVDALSKVLENWVHGGDADCIIDEFEELLNKDDNGTEK